jgi:hypothetical protein
MQHATRIGHSLDDSHPVKGGDGVRKSTRRRPVESSGTISSEVLSVVDDD